MGSVAFAAWELERDAKNGVAELGTPPVSNYILRSAIQEHVEFSKCTFSKATSVDDRISANLETHVIFRSLSELLQQLGIVLDRVLLLQRVLNSPELVENPREVLASVDGHFDALLTLVVSTPPEQRCEVPAPNTSAPRYSIDSELSAGSSRREAGTPRPLRASSSMQRESVGEEQSHDDFPQRVAIVSADGTSRSLTLSMLASEPASSLAVIDIFQTLDEATTDGRAAVIVYFIEPPVEFESIHQLPHDRTTSGLERKYVLVGEISEGLLEDIQDDQWSRRRIETVRPAIGHKGRGCTLPNLCIVAAARFCHTLLTAA